MICSKASKYSFASLIAFFSGAMIKTTILKHLQILGTWKSIWKTLCCNCCPQCSECFTLIPKFSCKHDEVRSKCTWSGLKQLSTLSTEQSIFFIESTRPNLNSILNHSLFHPSPFLSSSSFFNRRLQLFPSFFFFVIPFLNYFFGLTTVIFSSPYSLFLFFYPLVISSPWPFLTVACYNFFIASHELCQLLTLIFDHVVMSLYTLGDFYQTWLRNQLTSSGSSANLTKIRSPRISHALLLQILFSSSKI